MSDGKVITLVGETGSGKTTYVKETFLKVSKKEKFVFARVKNDYDDIPNVKCFTNFWEMLTILISKKNIIAVIDEGYSVLPTKLNVEKAKHEQIAIFLVNARKLNNFVFVINHSLRQTHLWELDYSDYFIRFNTNDLLQHQRNRFQSFPAVTDSLDSYQKIEKFSFDEIKIR